MPEQEEKREADSSLMGIFAASKECEHDESSFAGDANDCQPTQEASLSPPHTKFPTTFSTSNPNVEFYDRSFSSASPPPTFTQDKPRNLAFDVRATQVGAPPRNERTPLLRDGSISLQSLFDTDIAAVTPKKTGGRPIDVFERRADMSFPDLPAIEEAVPKAIDL